jgi:hypothetical protein
VLYDIPVERPNKILVGLLALLGLGGGAALSAVKVAGVASDGLSISSRATRFSEHVLVATSHSDDWRSAVPLAKSRFDEQPELAASETLPEKAFNKFAEECITGGCLPPDYNEPSEEQSDGMRALMALQAEWDAQKTEDERKMAVAIEEQRRMDMVMEKIRWLRANR